MPAGINTDRVLCHDVVRLYGFPGTFEVLPTTSDCYDFHARPIDSRNSGFPAVAASVVERNGRPCPCLSAPISPPASDYPHVPTFEYTDGPQSLAVDAVDRWLKSDPRDTPEYWAARDTRRAR